MPDFIFEDFEVNIDPEEPLFVISVVSEMVDIPIWTLRKLDEMGIVCPKRLGKKTRCYSKFQIQKLSFICHLMQDEGINISGIKYILELKEGKEGENEDI